jgi:transmembrane sensor
LIALHYVNEQGEWEYYGTPVGRQETVRLSDGSYVGLNTDTRVRVRMRAEERRIVVTRGEAMFEVAHDKARPFIVHVGGARVRAVGTAFAVRLHPDDRVDVTVTEGVVGIQHLSPLQRVLQGLNLSEPAADAMLVRAVRFVTDDLGRISTRTPAPEEVAARLSWRLGNVALLDITLAEAALEFNRYNTSPRLVLADPTIAGLRIGGVFRTTGVDSFIRSLQLMGVAVTRRSDASGVETVYLRKSGE